MNLKEINTLGKLKASGYKSRSVKDELRTNLISFLKSEKNPFSGIVGYDETVIPDLQTAILSRHNIILLGLRGQAKTRIARLFINLLDEYIPVIKDSDLNEDPFNPLIRSSKDLIEQMADDTPIKWIHRSERYTEKLATPDVTVADLIGDVDPIKAAALKLPYSDERVIHFGLIPRSHRSIFVINELPDLQARIQVALFNILQENDIQIRGFKIRLPLDIQFVFTANPEDYTNRGSIVTPLKDRIDSQILTHYPKNIALSRKITAQEAVLSDQQKKNIFVPELIKNLIEQIAVEARVSEYVDSKSGVSARLTISAFENLVSSSERRMIINNEDKAFARISDLYNIIPSITGKIELVYEGEQEGPSKVAHILISKAIKYFFGEYFPDPDKIKKNDQSNQYKKIIDWFSADNQIDITPLLSNKEYSDLLRKVDGLEELALKHHPTVDETNRLVLMEFILHGLAEFSLLSKTKLESGMLFKDMLSTMFTFTSEDDNEGEADSSDFFDDRT